MTSRLPPTHAALQRHLLEEVVTDIDAYLSVWVDRIEMLMSAPLAVLCDDASRSASSEDLEQERAQWKRERAEEIARLEDLQQRLTEAWEELECEQRELQRTKQALENRARSALDPTAAQHDTFERPAARHASPRPGIGGIDSPAMTDREESVRQFQQLRRESRQK